MSYSKMMMHTAKYPHCEVDRLLLGTFFKIRLPESYFQWTRGAYSLRNQHLWWPPTGPLFGHSAPERFISEDSRRPFQPSASPPQFQRSVGSMPDNFVTSIWNSQELSWRRASCSNRGTFGVCPRLKMGTKEYVVSILVKLDLYNFVKQIKRCFYVVGIPRKSFVLMFCLKKKCVYLIIYNFKRHFNRTQV